MTTGISRRVKSATSRLAAHQFIAPHLGEFHRRYPKVRLELVIDDGLITVDRSTALGAVQ